jgi:arylformamidase
MIGWKRLHDLTITLGERTPVFPGDPPFQRRSVHSLACGDETEVSTFQFCAHNGTHLDLPAHFIAGNPTLESLPPENFILPAVLIDNGTVPFVGPEAVRNSDAAPGEALLLRTANSAAGILTSDHFEEEYAYLAPEAAEACVELGVAMIGMDCFSVDRYGAIGYPSHRILLGAGVLILEGIDLSAVEPGRYTLIALPLKAEGAEASPVRAVLLK